MRKKITKILCMAAMVSLMTGCAQDKETTTTAQSSVATDTSTQEKDKTTDSKTEETTTKEQASEEATEEATTEEVTEAPQEIKDASAYSDLSNEKYEWWFMRNEENAQPSAQDKIDLTKYNAYYVAPTDEKVIYLTFDCGYENGFSNKILDVLKEQDVKAMFFVTQPFVRDNPDIAKRMKEEGHMVGNHTVSHPSLPSKDVVGVQDEILDCQDYFEETTGYKMDHFIRPPQGEYSEKTLQVTKDLGYTTVFWSIAYLDYDVNNQPGKDYVVEHFKKYYHNGAIPLIHNVSQSNTEALSDVITFLKGEGYRFGTLDELSSMSENQ